MRSEEKHYNTGIKLLYQNQKLHFVNFDSSLQEGSIARNKNEGFDFNL
jgi:hypothetical protein